MKVLVVHWQAAVADQIRAHLPQCQVTCESNGWSGLCAVRQKSYDLVISSYHLPVVTGFEMVRSMRLQSLNQRVPVILLEEGNETAAHHGLAKQLDAAFMPLGDVQKMKDLELWLN